MVVPPNSLSDMMGGDVDVFERSCAVSRCERLEDAIPGNIVLVPASCSRFVGW